MMTSTKTPSEIRAFKKAHEAECKKLAAFVTFKNGRRETLPGFFEQQDRCLEAKKQWRLALGYNE